MEGEGLVAHFAEGNIAQIIDPQVTEEEGGDKVEEVAALAASCVNIRGEGRPMMRQVEHTLEELRGIKKYNKGDDTVAEEGQRIEESSRRSSFEQEMVMSSEYPR
jgi:hypothetical protein